MATAEGGRDSDTNLVEVSFLKHYKYTHHARVDSETTKVCTYSTSVKSIHK